MENLENAVGLIISIVLLALLMGLPVWFLWNWALVPAVTVVEPIGFLQAIGLNVLFSIMFKSVKTSND